MRAGSTGPAAAAGGGAVVELTVALAGDGPYTVATPAAGSILLQAGVRTSAAYAAGVVTLSGPGLAGVLPLTLRGVALIAPGAICDGSPILATVAGSSGVGASVAVAIYSTP